MSWAIGWDSDNQRWKGYGVPCTCEHPDCNAEIDRGLSYLCEGCGLAFCGSHNTLNFCERCLDEDALDADVEELAAKTDATPFPAKPEHPEWLQHLRTDESWAEWRADGKNMQQLETWERATQAAKGVSDNGRNCTTCGGVGTGGLLGAGTIGSGEVMYDKATGRRVTAAELAEHVKAQRAARPQGEPKP